VDDGKRIRRHHRPPTEEQRDERVKLDMDPEDALRKLLGVPVADDDVASRPGARPGQ
jgi:hypothetical protein